MRKLRRRLRCVVLCVVVQSAVLAQHCTTCKGPVHSWDTFPVSFHSARLNTKGPTGLEFSAKDLATIAKFPLVTLEKWQGVTAHSTNNSSSGVFFWEEDAWISAARQIKAVSPNTSVAVWLDSVLIYTGWFFPPVEQHKKKPWKVNHTLNPDAKRPCTDGHFRAAEFLESHSDTYLLKNKSGMPALESWSGCHVYDHSKPAVRQYWLQMCLNLTSTGLIDGCGVDFSATGKNQWRFHTSNFIAEWFDLDADAAVAWNEGHTQMMRDTTQALGDGILIGKDPFELGDHVNAVLQETCPAKNGTIHLLQNLTSTSQKIRKRLVFQCHTKSPSVNSMAAFLCGAGVDHYYSIGGWKKAFTDGFDDHWNQDFERPLGEPLTDCLYDHITTTWFQ